MNLKIDRNSQFGALASDVNFGAWCLSKLPDDGDILKTRFEDFISVTLEEFHEFALESGLERLFTFSRLVEEKINVREEDGIYSIVSFERGVVSVDYAFRTRSELCMWLCRLLMGHAQTQYEYMIRKLGK